MEMGTNFFPLGKKYPSLLLEAPGAGGMERDYVAFNWLVVPGENEKGVK